MASRKKKTEPQGEDAFYEKLFALIAREGWVVLTLPAIAGAVKMPLSALLKTYPDKNALLAGFNAFLDRKLAAQAGDGDGPLKDRLFDIVMQRLDLLTPLRGGAIRLMEDMGSHPAEAAALMCDSFGQMRQSVRLMLDLAGAPREGLQAALLLHGLMLVYLGTLRTWKSDISKDLSATMATLDRSLDRLLRLARFS